MPRRGKSDDTSLAESGQLVQATHLREEIHEHSNYVAGHNSVMCDQAFAVEQTKLQGQEEWTGYQSSRQIDGLRDVAAPQYLVPDNDNS